MKVIDMKFWGVKNWHLREERFIYLHLFSNRDKYLHISHFPY